ncbi:MAG: 8-oxoguanine deaminase [Spirochaetaceae bacterium]|nr:MAG: 8-oxoguanine deaminase [Spirochaetaceae bacterium]
MILLKNCYALYPDPADPDCEPLRGVDLLIQGNRINRIGRQLPAPKNGIPPAAGSGASAALQTIDASRCVVVPGFVNTHHHFYQVLTRNLPAVQNAKLFTWLVYLYEIWKNIDEEAVLVSSQVALGELAKTGCTCTTDHHYLYPNGFSADLMGLQFEAADRIGMRFTPTRGSMSLSKKDGGLPPDSVVQTEEQILEDSLRVIEQYHDPSPLAMRKVVLAPCSPFSVSRELMVETARLARSHAVRLHTHLAETEDEDEYCLRKYGKRPLELMEQWEFVGEDVSYAHGIHFSDEELEVLHQSGTAVCHCPSSNMRLGSGIARVKEMIEKGITVSLAVDGSASNDASDFLGEMRQALFLQRVRYGADAITVPQIFALATRNGAKVLNFSELGRIEEGWGADLALFDVHKLAYAGALSDPLAALLFAGVDHRSEYTIINGRLVVRQGKLTGVDESDLTEKANRIAARIQKIG